MSHESLWLQIPEIVGIPFACLFIITLIKSATAERDFGNEQAVDVAMDITVLAAGSCGAIFTNDTLYEKYGQAMGVYGIFVVLVCIIFLGVLAWIRRWHNWLPVTTGEAVRNVLLGAIPLGLVTAVLIVGYTYNPGGK